jgi:hypothetical protein
MYFTSRKAIKEQYNQHFELILPIGTDLAFARTLVLYGTAQVVVLLFFQGLQGQPWL